MGTIETFDHTADVGLRIRAADLAEICRLGAEGVFDYIVANRSEIHESVEVQVVLEAQTPGDLLIAWLSELIYLSETRHQVYRSFAVEVSAEGCRLSATVRGEAIDASRHELDHEVKAVTHHGFLLEQKEDEWVAEVILDI